MELYKVTWYTVNIAANDKLSFEKKLEMEMFKVETNQCLIDFYNSFDEDSRLAPKHGTVEFMTTMR